MTHDFSDSNIIFVGGAPRSGTTLVQQMLAGHSLVYGGPEFDLMPEIVRLRNRFKSSIDSGRISVYLKHEDVDDLFREFTVATFKKKLNRIPGKRYISEKTPANAEVFPELAEICPGARMIFVVRDPRAVVASMLEVGNRYKSEGKVAPRFTRDLRVAIDYIARLWEAAASVAEKNRAIQVVYFEDITDAPEQGARAIAQHLGLQFEAGMLEMGKMETSEFKSNEHLWYTKDKLKAGIQRETSEKWREQLTPYQLFVIGRRFPGKTGISGRYDLSAPFNPVHAAMDSIGHMAFQARDYILQIGRKVYSWL